MSTAGGAAGGVARGARPDDEMGESKLPPAPSWQQLARLYWAQYVGLGLTILLLGVSERLEPYKHVLYHANDLEYWKVRLCV